jgi:hypothetical protein
VGVALPLLTRLFRLFLAFENTLYAYEPVISIPALNKKVIRNGYWPQIIQGQVLANATRFVFTIEQRHGAVPVIAPPTAAALWTFIRHMIRGWHLVCPFCWLRCWWVGVELCSNRKLHSRILVKQCFDATEIVIVLNDGANGFYLASLLDGLAQGINQLAISLQHVSGLDL